MVSVAVVIVLAEFTSLPGEVDVICSSAVYALVSQLIRVKVDPERIPGYGKFRWSPERRAAKRRARLGPAGDDQTATRGGFHP